jgi:hypothetical protein
MAQSALTVTPPNPSPPTNFPSTGTTGPNPTNYTKTNYANVFNLTPAASGANGTTLVGDSRPVTTIPGVGVNPNPAPYYDDGSAGAALVFAANVAALAGGTAATSGGTENTYPGIGGLTPPAPNQGGAVPASTSVAHEGAGSETVVTASVPNPSPAGQLVMFSCMGNFTGVANSPNSTHASSLSPAVNPTLTTIAPTTAASGASGTVALTAVTGVGFNRQSVVYANGVAIPTVFVSSTTLTATMPKKTSAGTWPVTVVTGGVVTTTAQTFTWT